MRAHIDTWVWVIVGRNYFRLSSKLILHHGERGNRSHSIIIPSVQNVTVSHVIAPRPVIRVRLSHRNGWGENRIDRIYIYFSFSFVLFPFILRAYRYTDCVSGEGRQGLWPPRHSTRKCSLNTSTAFNACLKINRSSFFLVIFFSFFFGWIL